MATLERHKKGELMKETPKKIRPSKDVLIREIAERTDLFDFTSLKRTNIQNLGVIKTLLEE